MENIEQAIAILDLHYERREMLSVEDNAELGRFLLSKERERNSKLIEALQKFIYLQLHPISYKNDWKLFKS